ncbi:MAG: hypothetical protein ACJAS1_000852 [Oleiphilaceae bacterium]|jgi:hypothetical protein
MNSQYEEYWKYLKLLPVPKNPLQMADTWEAEVHGHRDGEGKRHWIPALYLLGGDAEQAYLYFQTYEEANLQESAHLKESLTASPEYLLCSLLAYIKLHKNTDFSLCGGYLARRLYGANPYVIPTLLGKDCPIKQHWHRSNKYGLEYAKGLPGWIYELWSLPELEILSDCFHSIEFQGFTSVDDALWKIATDHPVDEKKSAALNRHRVYRGVMIGER